MITGDSFPDGSSWSATMGNIDTAASTFTVFAVCLTA
jgi:hypothetical protein